MKNYAFQVFYLGQNYLGFQRQPNGQTVENHLEFAFVMSNMIDCFADNDYKSCSRTDQGVNAISNVFTLLCKQSPILTQLNSYLPPDIIVWSYAVVSDEFNPRHKVTKQYRYFLKKNLIAEGCDIDRIYDFLGVYDFTAFLRKHGAGMDYAISNIKEIKLQDRNNFLVIDIFGDRFGREQIRRMIGFLIQDKFQDISPDNYLDISKQIDIKAAPPQYLVLVKILYNSTINWQIDPKLMSLIRNQCKLLSDNLDGYLLQSNIIDDFIQHLT